MHSPLFQVPLCSCEQSSGVSVQEKLCISTYDLPTTTEKRSLLILWQQTNLIQQKLNFGITVRYYWIRALKNLAWLEGVSEINPAGKKELPSQICLCCAVETINLTQDTLFLVLPEPLSSCSTLSKWGNLSRPPWPYRRVGIDVLQVLSQL